MPPRSTSATRTTHRCRFGPLRASTAPFGDSVVALVIMLASGGAAALARRTGASRFGQVLAAALIVCATRDWLVLGTLLGIGLLHMARRDYVAGPGGPRHTPGPRALAASGAMG